MKKIFILLPDGVGIKNFAFTNFKKIATSNKLEIVYWNNTVFDLEKLNAKQVTIFNGKLHPLTHIYKNVRKHLEISENTKRFNDLVYKNYLFPLNTDGLKNKIRSTLTRFLIKNNKSEKGLNNIINKTYELERNTAYYHTCVAQLKEHKPNLVLCTNQRTSLAIAPIEAAKSLGIKTACFIYSWDNLPKAMLLIETDYYFVWSEYMEKELLKYYPHIKKEQIYVTGTPQFENHFDAENLLSKEEFYQKYKLNKERQYFLYSGDDVTTSPNDPLYIEDIAKTIQNLNNKGYNFGIIFRRCPVDFSTRFDKVIEKYEEIIVPITPAWKQLGGMWNQVMPTIEDMQLQANCIHHTLGVLNLGSSMVFDAIAHNKTCAYMNYDAPDADLKKWNVEKIYNYVHFRSMPSNQAVFWVNKPADIEQTLLKMTKSDTVQHQEAKKWFSIINQYPANQASVRMIDAIKQILS
ncbi:UDP-glycosyltransferase [Flavobacterium agricola]|uniref:UDP-glycosyltransferase n=1 Tax=Flavobacterium agricola TaxID=2870839 RepID=A0ABY6LZB7_9FLAO|nr:UDP-glycosyltransferase [Flavobacterium agricola]UYW00505.1 UDP-glycosyltransferase [Flavobacterium agricola]